MFTSPRNRRNRSIHRQIIQKKTRQLSLLTTCLFEWFGRLSYYQIILYFMYISYGVCICDHFCSSLINTKTQFNWFCTLYTLFNDFQVNQWIVILRIVRVKFQGKNKENIINFIIKFKKYINNMNICNMYVQYIQYTYIYLSWQKMKSI